MSDYKEVHFGSGNCYRRYGSEPDFQYFKLVDDCWIQVFFLEDSIKSVIDTHQDNRGCGTGSYRFTEDGQLIPPISVCSVDFTFYNKKLREKQAHVIEGHTPCIVLNDYTVRTEKGDVLASSIAWPVSGGIGYSLIVLAGTLHGARHECKQLSKFLNIPFFDFTGEAND